MADPRDDIIRALAIEACERVTKRAIAALKSQPAELSGDDSKLGTVWEEFCVQVQEGESVFWDGYELTACQAIEAELAQIPQHEREAIWLQSDPGWDWLWDLINPDESTPEKPDVKVPADDSDSAVYVYREYLLPSAEEYSSPSIDRYQAHLQRGRAELDGDPL